MRNEARKKRKQKARKIKIITAGIVLLLCLFGWLITNSQFVKGLIYKDSSFEKNTVLSVDESISGDYTVFGDDILFTTKNGLCLYSMDGKLIHTNNYDEISTVISKFANPVVRVSGEVITAFDKEGRELVIFNNKRVINKAETEYNIQTVKVFNNGGFAAITADAGAKNQMILFGKTGKKEFVWHSGGDNIVDAAVTDDGNTIAVLSAELVSGALNTKVLFFKKGEAEPYATKKYDNVLITNINFTKGTNLTAISDSAIYYINGAGEEKNCYSFNGKFLSAFKLIDNGSCILNFSSISDSSNHTEIVSKNGKLKGSYNSDKTVKSIDYKNNNILLVHENTADIISMRGNRIRSINYGREVEDMLFIGRNKILIVGKSEVKIIR